MSRASLNVLIITLLSSAFLWIGSAMDHKTALTSQMKWTVVPYIGRTVEYFTDALPLEAVALWSVSSTRDQAVRV